jgi:hypothetical protein
MSHIVKDLLKVARSLVSVNTKFPKFQKWIPEKSDAVTDLMKISPKGTDLEIWTWNSDRGTHSLVLSPQTKKPKIDWTTSESRMQSYIKSVIDKRRRVLERREEARKERAEFKHDLQVGDILTASWGYDQTNVNFYEVIGVTEKSVKIREIAQKVAKSGIGYDKVVPVPGKFIDSPMTKKVSPQGYVKIKSYIWASKWDGKPENQTPFGYGH